MDRVDSGRIPAWRVLVSRGSLDRLAGAPGVTAYMLHRARVTGTLPPPAPRWTPLAEISPYLVASVVKAEDPRFFTHRGIDWREMVQVLRRRLRGGALRGLSTITQQLARNLFLSPRRALSRKALEGVIALRLERAFDKLRILEIYLNVVEWGDGVWGIEAASRHYFDRSPAELDAFESAFLAALLPAPRRPLQGWFARRARGSFHYVFFQLKEEGFATQPDFEGALARMDGLLAATTRGVRTRDALEALARFAPRRIPAHGGSPSLHEVVERLRR